jgi:hypothetical protein
VEGPVSILNTGRTFSLLQQFNASSGASCSGNFDLVSVWCFYPCEKRMRFEDGLAISYGAELKNE